MDNWTLYASHIGKINRLEELKFAGMGKIITNHLEKYSLNKEVDTIIIIEEKDFNTKYDISLRHDIKFNIVIASGISNGKDTKFNEIDLKFQGGSNSVVLVSLIVHHVQMLKEIDFVSGLTSWQMFNIVSANFHCSIIKY